MKVYKRITFPTWLLMELKSSTCLEKHQFQEICRPKRERSTLRITK